MTQAVVLMSKDEAAKFTAAIKRRIARTSGDIEAIKGLLIEAEQREVWRVAGYRSMAAYVTTALGMSRRNAYRTLDQARATLMLAAESVPRVTESDQLPRPSQREAGRITAPLKQKRARRGPPSIAGWLQGVRDGMDRIDGAFEMADDDALAYLAYDDRRAFERTVTKAAEWSESWANRLSAPVPIREADEWVVA